MIKIWRSEGKLILTNCEECPCDSIETEDGCDQCCNENTIPTELSVTVPAGWTDGTECDQCDEMGGDWILSLDSFSSPGSTCSFFGAACATWSYTQTDWCLMDCDNGLGDVYYTFEIEVQLWCNRPTLSECQLEAFVGVSRSAADDDPCPREARQKYVLARSSVPEDCSAWSGLSLSASGAMIGDTDVCDNPPASITVSAA